MLVGGEGDGFLDVVLGPNPLQDPGHAKPTAGVGYHVFFGFIDVPSEVVNAAAHIKEAFIHFGVGEAVNEGFGVIDSSGGTDGLAGARQDEGGREK